MKGDLVRESSQEQSNLPGFIPPSYRRSRRQDLEYRLRVREDFPAFLLICRRDDPADCFENSKEFTVRNSSVRGELPATSVELYSLTINHHASTGLAVFDHRAISKDGISG
ncbi:hypothetical protein FOL47_007787 [Perkinsus chesapeaki]|uniref:Uncharacterized protein n=1 Tax=Perkinsus chesapeaki TaxID=330153 RepID=A0A7J6LID1_PERCH|nr:hypothetical protein FOL47_007787 [Perkinsus chesapeaki]